MPKEIFTDIATEPAKERLTLHEIGLATATEIGVNISNVKKRSKKQDIVEARQQIAQKAYNEGYTYRQIANYLGQDDHTTVYYYLNKKP